MTSDYGNFHDNAAILAQALALLRAGAAEEALWTLVELRRQILKGGEAKSKIWLIPEIDQAVEVAHARCRGTSGFAQGLQTTGRQLSQNRPWSRRLERSLLQWAALITLAFTIVKVLWHDWPRFDHGATAATSINSSIEEHSDAQKERATSFQDAR